MKILSFRLDEELFAVEINRAKEINRNVEYTIVPLADPRIIGLINLRGQVVTLFDLAVMIGHEPSPVPDRVTCLILKDDSAGPNQRGFVINTTGDVLDVDNSMIVPPPPNTNPGERQYIKAVVRTDTTILRLLDTDALFSKF